MKNDEREFMVLVYLINLLIGYNLKVWGNDFLSVEFFEVNKMCLGRG